MMSQSPWVRLRLRCPPASRRGAKEWSINGRCQGADTRFIQANLGDARLSTTEIYSRVSIEKLREVHVATHPAKVHRALDDEEASL